MKANNQNNYINEAEIRKALQILKPEGQVFEVRIIGNSKPLSGYFQDADSLIHALQNTRLAGVNVYISLQRVNPDCMARSQRNCFMAAKTSTTDNDILAYDWLFIDVDPERTSGTSSSEAELQSSYETARRVQEYLSGRGFKEPVKAVSGNGAHLLYKIDLENSPEGRKTIEKVLKVISLYMSDDKCKVDVVNSNPSRICKLYGTLAQKGTSTTERPHRMSRIISVPEKIECTPFSLLKRLAKELPDETRQDPNNSQKYSDFDIESWMHEHGLNYNSKAYGGTMMYILDECPFDSNHKAPDAKIFKYANGRIGFKCWHNSCNGKHWKDVRQLLEPGAYNNEKNQSAKKSAALYDPGDMDLAQEFSNKESQALFERIKQIDPANSKEYRRCTDMDNAKLFVELFKDAAMYNTSAKEWYVYDGKRWTKDEGGKITESFAISMAAALGRYSGIVGEQSYALAASKLHSRAKRTNMIRDAECLCVCGAEDFDKDPYLFNCQNGVLDLRTQAFKPHNPQQMLSKISNAVYDPEAKSELFLKFIDEVMCQDKALTEYVQQIFGYALTGENTQEECYILYGATTRNGKSTLLDTMRYIFGEYAANAQPETVAKRDRNSSSPSGDIARLAGVRLVQMSEAPKDMNWDAALVKQLTGRDEITARFLHENDFQFVPVFKLIMNTNHLPMVTDDTLFTSGRMKVIPFERQFSPAEQDVHLKRKLKSQENIPGIFNWILAGLRAYMANGEILTVPEKVSSATDEYRVKSDKVQLFINECLELRIGHVLPGSQVYAQFQQWCSDSGLRELGKRKFFDALRVKDMLYQDGYVNGRTEHNVIKNYAFSEGILKE